MPLVSLFISLRFAFFICTPTSQDSAEREQSHLRKRIRRIGNTQQKFLNCEREVYSRSWVITDQKIREREKVFPFGFERKYIYFFLFLVRVYFI